MNENSQNNTDQERTSTSEKRRFESMTDALQAGKNDGAAKAREKGPALKSGIADAAHDLAYGLAYGSVFAGAFLNELIPQSIRDGFSRGASAGKTAGQGTYQKVCDGLSTDKQELGENLPPNPSFS